MLCKPCNGFLHKLCEISAVRRNDGFPFQSVKQVHVLCFGKGILQIVVIIGETGVGLDLADAVGLQDCADGNAVISANKIRKGFLLLRRALKPVTVAGFHGLEQPRHVLRQRAHGLKALQILLRFLGREAMDLVPVL